MYPALGSLNRNCACAVLALCYCVVNSGAYYLFFCADNGVFNILTKSEADSSAASCLDKIVLRAGIEGVLSVNKFRVQYYVSLLR